MRLNWILPTLFLLAPLMLGACSSAKDKLGLTKSAPDEFKVVKRAPLSMPPDFSLRPPRPGAARPQEQAPVEEARQTVFGKLDDSAQTGEPSSAEMAVLQKAGSDNANPEIRYVIDNERIEFDDKNKPVAERILGITGLGGSEDQGNVIDPAEEAKRLQEMSAAQASQSEAPQADETETDSENSDSE